MRLVKHTFLYCVIALGFSNISLAMDQAEHDFVYESSANKNKLVDVLGWGGIQWRMKEEVLSELFGSRLVEVSPKPMAPGDFYYIITNVQLGPLTADMKVGLVHESDDGPPNAVTNLLVHHQETYNKELVINMGIYFTEVYGQAKVLEDGFYSKQGNYAKRMKWEFPTTTIILNMTHRMDLNKTIIGIIIEETVSEKHSRIVSKELLDTVKNEHKLIVIRWKTQPVFILYRNKEEVDFIKKGIAEKYLADPKSYAPTSTTLRYTADRYPLDFNSYAVHQPIRSQRDEFGVYLASGSSGCLPILLTEKHQSNEYYPSKAENEAIRNWGKAWKRGFYDPCRGDYYDLAGRIYKKAESEGANLAIPKHRYDHEGNIIIGY